MFFSLKYRVRLEMVIRRNFDTICLCTL